MESSVRTHGTLKNPFLTVEYLTLAGPRLSALIPAGTQQNLLARLDNVFWDTPYGKYVLFGGHRLWAAPEIPEVTYFPETSGVQVLEAASSVKLRREDHGAAAYERSLEVRLEENAPRLHIEHIIRNLAAGVLPVAPWSISVLPMGARVRIPHSTALRAGNEFLPNRSLAFWPYDDLRDPRLAVQNEFVELKSDPTQEAFKIGVFSSRGWAAAQIGEWLLVKHFAVREADPLLDFGCNVEAYTNRRFVEFELVGELRNLRPGESVNLIEDWEVLHANLDDLDEDGRLPT